MIRKCIYIYRDIYYTVQPSAFVQLVRPNIILKKPYSTIIIKLNDFLPKKFVKINSRTLSRIELSVLKNVNKSIILSRTKLQYQC